MSVYKTKPLFILTMALLPLSLVAASPAAAFGTVAPKCQCECNRSTPPVVIPVYYDKGLTDLYFDFDVVGTTKAQQDANCAKHNGGACSGWTE